MRFVHISDTHIAASPEFSNYGHSPLRNLERAINEINALPFEIDFVLHTGDVVEDLSEAAYRSAKLMLDKLKYPIYYVAGNHDDPALLQQVLLGQTPSGERFDYRFECKGVQVAVFDSRGLRDPSGMLTDAQLAALRDLCTPDGPPLALALHHPPLPLDSRWLDEGWSGFHHMLLECGEPFMESIAPARDRIRGVFFGHVHRTYQVWRDGILLSSAPSTFGQLLTWPDQAQPLPSPAELGGMNLVTIEGRQTIVRQYGFARP